MRIVADRIRRYRHQTQLKDFGLPQPAPTVGETFNSVVHQAKTDTHAGNDAALMECHASSTRFFQTPGSAICGSVAMKRIPVGVAVRMTEPMGFVWS